VRFPARVDLHVVTLSVFALGIAAMALASGRYLFQAEPPPNAAAQHEEPPGPLEPPGVPEPTELQELERQYGPERNSEHAEEWIIRDFFKGTRDGIFVDVGANRYKRFNNTYYLDIVLGWSGLAIEPQTKFAREYARFRPRTTFVPLFVSDTSNHDAVLYVPPIDLAASESRKFAESYGGSSTALHVRTTSLDDVLERSGMTHIDFLTMDIELAEPKALAGFSIQRYRPSLACVEAHPEVRQQVLDYFARNGYVLIGKYLRVDDHNLWFTPLAK
jgi:FkbM family methyltransferase